ncbi:MAG: hypothetical protein KGH64_04530 [Candidatus Micrarchaeota archaeon]|nr:hypothetical protein [Candidatus Micrarchaeota archaeon]
MNNPTLKDRVSKRMQMYEKILKRIFERGAYIGFTTIIVVIVGYICPAPLAAMTSFGIIGFVSSSIVGFKNLK